MTTINFVIKITKKISTKKINKLIDDDFSTTNDIRINIVKKFLIIIMSINETKIKLKTKIFANNFHNIKIVDVTTSINAINLTIINNYSTTTLTKNEFVKKIRFEIMTTKFCLTKNFCEIIF